MSVGKAAPIPEAPLVRIIEELRCSLAQKEAELEELRRQLAAKDEQIQSLEEEIRLLRHRLGQTSQNSHNPPSQDRFIKPRSRRRPTGRSQGAQPGHEGHTLHQVPEADEVQIHTAPERCASCGHSLDGAAAAPCERRQVFDLPDIRLRVIEHQLQGKQCPACGRLNRASAPPGVEQPAQYGPGVAALAVYLHVHQLIPFDRLRQVFIDLFGQPISTGTLSRMLATADEDLLPVEAAIHQQLLETPVVHYDETGIRIQKNAWLHVASTDRLTLFHVDPKRGSRALDAINVLPNFHGVAVHDCYPSYFGYTDCAHALCNAHILRELEAAFDLTGQAWPHQLRDLLSGANQRVESAKAQGQSALPTHERDEIHEQYTALVNQGRALNPVQAERPGRRGRTKKTKIQNLLERLSQRQDDALRFVDDFRVPFTNNQAEQDLRMAKVKQKISGGFRTDIGAQRFYRIRTYVSTARKCAFRPIEALHRLFLGQPFIPIPTRGP